MSQNFVDKTIARKFYLALRSSIPTEEKYRIEKLLINKCLKFLTTFPKSLIIAAYYPVKTEYNILPLYKKLVKLRYKLVLPVVVKGQKILKFREWNLNEELSLDDFQVPAPNATKKEIIPDIIITPLLAFDRDKNRLGYGKGCYDITISMLREKKKIYTIGICHSCQIAENLPIEIHDQKLDIIITEKEIIT